MTLVDLVPFLLISAFLFFFCTVEYITEQEKAKHQSYEKVVQTPKESRYKAE